MKTTTLLHTRTMVLLGLACLASMLMLPCLAQDDSRQASINSSIGADGTGTIVVEARGHLPILPPFYTATADAVVQIETDHVEQEVQLAIKVIQGTAKRLSFGLSGDGQVTAVAGDGTESWSVRQVGARRFLDLHLKEDVSDANAVISIRSPEAKYELPSEIQLTHLTQGESVGFNSSIRIQYDPAVEGAVTVATGFAPLDSEGDADRFQTTTGGQLKLSLRRSGVSPAPVELIDTDLQGTMHSNGESIGLQLRSTAVVTEDNEGIIILSGNAAVSEVPSDANYRLRLSNDNERPVYKLVFDKAGTYPVTLNFVATLLAPDSNGHRIDFTIAAGTVVPITLSGLGSDLVFHRDQQSVVPLRDKDKWLGFLPATGHAQLQWKTARKTDDGKLFFTTTGQVEAKVGVGLLRQDHQIDYQVLQGELKSLSILMRGPGEILDVQGDKVVAWKVSGKAEDRQLDITLSQPIAGTSQIRVRSQTPLGAFPVRVEGLRLNPMGAIRHSGFLRLSNLGSVRVEPTGLSGLTQLAPEQFPGEPIEARQVFVYRFPSADHDFTLAADRIQPEVSISQLVLYQLDEADRVIKADIELDIREAPIREWDFGIPADYSIVSVTGANVADYIAATEIVDSRRNLKVMFDQDVEGRQLVSLHLEKSEAAVAGNWVLPRIEFPGAKAVRGDIGIIGGAGYRITIEETELLVEKPLSYFPKPTAGLQQTFRIREPEWSARMRVELLERSVQADVFHLYSLSQETVYGSALINYFVTGAPVSEWKIVVPPALGNVMVDGQDVRTWRREDDVLIVSLHQPVMGGYTLLVTFEEKPDENQGSFQAGQIAPLGVQSERGYIQVVSPMQVEMNTVSVSDDMLKLDPLELPAEFRLLSTAPPLGTWQYTDRPFALDLKVDWFQPGTTLTQVVEFSEVNSRVSQDGELVTDVLYYVKSRGQRTLRVKLPDDPVRLWKVSVNGQVATARQADDATLIPLPGGINPNIPIEVRLSLGKPTVDESDPELTLPIVFAPVLKTQWNIVGDEKRVLIPRGGTFTPSVPVTRASGFDWVAKHGMVPLVLIGLFTGIGIWACAKSAAWPVLGLLSIAIAIGVSVFTASTAFAQLGSPVPLQLSLPNLSAGETIRLHVQNTPLWRVDLSWIGLVALLGGVAAIAWSFIHDDASVRMISRWIGMFLIALGILMQGGGAPWFYVLLAVGILVLVFVRPALDSTRGLGRWLRNIAEKPTTKMESDGNDGPDAEPGVTFTPIIILFALVLSFACSSVSAADPSGFDAADSIKQQWRMTHQDSRLTATGTITLSGQPGDRFLLLEMPAVLTRFDGKGLRLSKQDVPGQGLSYIISIPVNNDTSEVEEVSQPNEATEYKATFEYRLEAVKPLDGVPVLTGIAAVREINLRYDEAGWDVVSPTAVRVESVDSDDQATEVNLLLGTGEASVILKPKARDVTLEETNFFVETSNLYLPGPGVVDGRHRLHLRTSQGQLSELAVLVPKGLTVSAVSGPVGSWQFDADQGRLKLQIEPAQSNPFDVIIDTQRGLDSLPSDVTLSPLRVADAGGEVGLVAIAFGADAQPEKLDSQGMSAVNLADFDASLILNKQVVLHRVYRYGSEGGELTLRVAPVESEVRVISKQVLSLGDERVVLGINFAAEITRTGLFQLSFPLPDGLEVESLSGASLHHWAELSEGDQRQIVLHLNGKTIGSQSFSLTLSGTAPNDPGDWKLPRFELNEATRQTGELVVRPTTGIRLRTVSRQNVSETDPRSMGGKVQGSLAFRLLQRDWDLVLGIEKLEPWVTGQVLHEITLREGQTRSALIAEFDVQNASIRTLAVALPIADEDEIKTLRASGDIVSDFVRTAPDSDVWEVQFKRHVIGKIQFRIEYERRGDRESPSTNGQTPSGASSKQENEVLVPAEFPDARQLSYYFGVRAGGRFELEHDPLPQSWQRADWNTVPQTLRDAGNRTAPALVLRAVPPANSLRIVVKRHSLADALKLRVAKGTFTTVLSPSGNQLTAVDATIEVIQRSSLSVGLPEGGELFSIFVNGESVNSIRLGGNGSLGGDGRQGNDGNVWQFYILPGIDDRTAKVRFVYSVASDRPARRNDLRNLTLASPEMNVPLENIQWSVVAPKGFELIDHDGNLELVQQANQEEYNRSSYLSKSSGKRQVQAQQATKLLEQANQLIQAGEQAKARRALSSVANQYALDAASNEDARVQLENLQTQQAIVGLNTRRQRLYLDNKPSDIMFADNPQFREAASDNPILHQDEVNFHPQQLSELLRGNSSEDNAVLGQIAGRLVEHQHTTDPAAQAIIISLPEEGAVYTFSRSVQVAENEPLKLELDFVLQHRVSFWQTALLVLLLSLFAAILTVASKRQLI
ncbi:putative membrane protein [Rhodopirellula maiorica SM1]|uniref:Putative membrane protein n=1 Tax=Rhodopirellula maiorica SM1 TaxID=1265738 RepID=M5S165_9BACT|nr:DUF308 domain-containing protein [Rhodopirellula maiorica]EMI21392.1 putative membrane protein [Rhodopirellula maiorica SM1]